MTTSAVAGLAGPGPALAVPDGRRRRGLRRHAPRIELAVGLGVVLGVLAAGWLLPLRYDATSVDVAAILKPPSGAHWFGTDEVGQDVFARTVRAARSDLPLALVGTALATVLGVLGGIATSSRSRWAGWSMRLVDAFQTLPILIVISALVVVANHSPVMVALSIALISTPFYLRLVRSQALSLREGRFVDASIAAGTSPLRVMTRHLLPNLRSLIFAQTALTAAGSLLLVAALSFLGVGIVPPTPSWGAMIKTGSTHLVTGEWWTAFFPALPLFACILSFNLVADALRDLAARKRSTGSTR